MPRRDFYPFYPQRILWTGAAVLGGGFATVVAFFVFWIDSSPLSAAPLAKKNMGGNVEKRLSFSLNLKEAPVSFPIPRLEPEMTFSFDSLRPDRSMRNSDLFIRLKQSGQSKRISLPCHIGLQFNGGKLCFRETASPFWLELTGIPEERIQATVWIENASKESTEVERFITSPQASPLLGPQEFAEGSPFRVLGEAKWLGHDVFSEKYEGKQTLLVSVGAHPNAQIFDLREKEWIIWQDGRWIKGPLDGKASGIARIETVDSRSLTLEGWDEETHIRLSLPYVSPSLFKMRGEDLFNSIRVRSEKQISCMIEKQCLILRAGDWVLKWGGRWKILRKKEEKDAYRSGKIKGELFVFEKIEVKQGQKCVSGFLFNAEKSQVIPIDLPANQHPSRKETKER